MTILILAYSMWSSVLTVVVLAVLSVRCNRKRAARADEASVRLQVLVDSDAAVVHGEGGSIEDCYEELGIWL